MLLSICMTTGRNAMGDSYKNIINQLPDKNKIVCIVPGDYEVKEFSKDFNQIIVDQISHATFRLLKACIFAWNLRKLVIEKKIKKVFFYFDNHWFNVILYFVLLGLNIELFMWVHDPVLHLGANYKDKFIRWVNSKIMFSKIKKIIVSYQDAIEELTANYKVAVEQVRVIVLPQMEELEFEDIRAMQNQEQYDFMFFGRIEEYKGIDLLIEVINQSPQWTLLIVGNGNYFKNIWNKIRECKNITFLNRYVENRELATYIKKSKWIILPYKTATGSQTVQIANYYGKPVLVTRVGCFNEYVKDNVNGLFIDKYCYNDLKNAMHTAINKDRKQFSKLILENFQKEFSISKTVDKLKKILDL